MCISPILENSTHLKFSLRNCTDWYVTTYGSLLLWKSEMIKLFINILRNFAMLKLHVQCSTVLTCYIHYIISCMYSLKSFFLQFWLWWLLYQFNVKKTVWSEKFSVLHNSKDNTGHVLDKSDWKQTTVIATWQVDKTTFDKRNPMQTTWNNVQNTLNQFSGKFISIKPKTQTERGIADSQINVCFVYTSKTEFN